MKNGLAYNKKTLHATAGQVTIVFTNRSHLKHDFRLEIGEKEYGGTRKIGHGTTRVTLTLAKGKYHFFTGSPCAVMRTRGCPATCTCRRTFAARARR